MKIIESFIAIGTAMTMMLHTLPTCADNQELIKKRATAYCLQGITSTGTEVRPGVAASTDKELIGKTIIMYQRLPDNEVGKLIGIYQIEDTGDMSKHVIDVWQQDLEACQQFMNLIYEDGCGGKVWIQVLEAKG